MKFLGLDIFLLTSVMLLLYDSISRKSFFRKVGDFGRLLTGRFGYSTPGINTDFKDMKDLGVFHKHI